MVLNPRAPHFVVLGAGAIGRIIVRDLLESSRKNRILVADFDGGAARSAAAACRSSRVRSVRADASDPEGLGRILRGHSIVINCTRHHFNLNVMEAALKARLHYVDLGGLFVWTRRQLRLNGRYRDAGLIAILGMGCAPGLTNVMAMHAARGFKRVDSIRIRVGSIDLNPKAAGFTFPYSARTIVEELTLPPWRWSRGRFVKSAPHSGWERVRFGEPVGTQWAVITRHSEIATLPVRLRRRGIRYVDFKVGFDRAFVRELLRRLKSGQTVTDFEALGSPRETPNDYEITRVIIRGDGQTVTTECHARARPEWHASAGDMDTACPASVVAQMMVSGAVPEPGVFAPEDVVPAEALFDQMRKRGMKIVAPHGKNDASATGS